jgi:O-antigen ligase
MPPEPRRRGIGDGRTRRALTLQERLWLGATPALIAGAHIAFGASSRALSAFLVLAIGLLLLARWSRSPPFRMDGMWVPAVAFAAVVILAVWSLTPFTLGERQPIWQILGSTPATTIDKSATVREIAKLIGLGAVFLIGTLQGRRRRDADATVDALIATGAVVMAVAMLMFVARLEPAGFGGRMSGPFPSPNAMGSIAAALLVLSIARVVGYFETHPIRGGREAIRSLEAGGPYLAATVIFGMALVLTASRGAMAAAGLALCFWIGWRLVTGRTPVRIVSGLAILAGGVGGFILLTANQGLVLDRAGLVRQDWQDRLSAFQIYWRVFLESPLFGYGLGSFDAINRQILDSTNIDQIWNFGAAHNVGLQWLLEAGAVGTLPMVVCIAAIDFSGLAHSIRSRATSATFGGVCMAQAVLAIHGMVDIGLQIYSIATLFAFLLGLQLAISTRPGSGSEIATRPEPS